MRRKRKGHRNALGRLVIVGMLFTSLLLSSCGGKTSDPVELMVIHGWGSTEADHVAMRQIYSDFQKENPDISLKLVSMPTNEEMIRKVEDMLMVGELPDVVFLGGTGRDSIYRFMVENQRALDLMPYLKEDAAFCESIAPINLEYWTTDDGKLYTISDVLQLSGGYWYNEEIFKQAGIEELPQTWEEFLAVCERLSVWAKQEENGVVPLFVPPEGYLYFADHMMAVNGGKMQEAVGENHIEIVEDEMDALLDGLEQIYRYSSSETDDYSYRDATDLFNSGKLAMYVNGTWAANMISEGIDAGYALLPSGEGNTLSCESAGLGYMLGNTKDERRVEASVRFLKYMMSEEVQERILHETKQIPANPKVNITEHQEELRLYEAAQTVLDAGRKIEIPTNLWTYEQRSVFEQHILEVLSGELNRQTFMDLM